jgi:hypothetical protein
MRAAFAIAVKRGNLAHTVTVSYDRTAVASTKVENALCTV